MRLLTFALFTVGTLVAAGYATATNALAPYAETLLQALR